MHEIAEAGAHRHPVSQIVVALHVLRPEAEVPCSPAPTALRRRGSSSQAEPEICGWGSLRGVRRARHATPLAVWRRCNFHALRVSQSDMAN
jgi:hypothetical protein